MLVHCGWYETDPGNNAIFEMFLNQKHGIAYHIETLETLNPVVSNNQKIGRQHAYLGF